jgi:hypothetical protein
MTYSPYQHPKLSLHTPSYWMFPGYTGQGAGVPHINTIYNHVLKSLDKSPHNNFERRYKDYVLVRYWTMFISMCLGYSSIKVGLFFQKDHSTALHASKRIMGEIEHYDDSREVFKYFESIYNIGPNKTQSKTIKRFLRTWKNKQNM